MDRSTVFPDARKLLRDATHAEHVRLNQHPMLTGITRPNYPLATYQQVLTAYWHLYRELEAAIDQALQARVSSFSYDLRRKLPWLASDLSYFGLDPDATHHRPASAVARMALLDEGKLLGALYTIEGSSLGGLVISRHLAAHLGITPARGGRFFHGYGDETMHFWSQFEAFMNAALTNEGARNSAVHAAKSTFSMMGSMLDDYLARNQSANCH